MRIQIEIHVLHRKQGDGHVIALFHLFLEDQVIAQALYAAVSLCGRLLSNQESTAPSFRQETFRCNKSYPISLKFFMLCPMRYSPIMYTFELKVMPHVICGFSWKSGSSAPRPRPDAWRRGSVPLSCSRENAPAYIF